ncbi:hypothetical protein T261_5563 [Streptomyces lydicus]|nr:hypothetical protein T261_5563 [Streptomyces lydicus]
MKIAVQRVRLGDTEYRVIRPVSPFKKGALYVRGDSYDLYVDRADGRRIGTLFLLAARSPHSLVYLPMRATAPEPWFGWDADEKPIDLVLAHRAVQFRPSRWKRLRERIAAGSTPRELRTASVPARDLPDLESSYEPPDDPKEAQAALLRQHVHAETLLLTGGAPGFREAAREIFAVTKDGPPAAASPRYIHGGCNYHVCRCLYDYPDLTENDWGQIHVEFNPRWSR